VERHTYRSCRRLIYLRFIKRDTGEDRDDDEDRPHTSSASRPMRRRGFSFGVGVI